MDRTVKLWDLATLGLQKTLVGHEKVRRPFGRAASRAASSGREQNLLQRCFGCDPNLSFPRCSFGEPDKLTRQVVDPARNTAMQWSPAGLVHVSFPSRPTTPVPQYDISNTNIANNRASSTWPTARITACSSLEAFRTTWSSTTLTCPAPSVACVGTALRSSV